MLRPEVQGLGAHVLDACIPPGFWETWEAVLTCCPALARSILGPFSFPSQFIKTVTAVETSWLGELVPKFFRKAESRS